MCQIERITDVAADSIRDARPAVLPFPDKGEPLLADLPADVESAMALASQTKLR